MPGGPLGIPVEQVLQVGANVNGVQEVPDVCFVWVGSRGPITMLVYRLWYRRELTFTIQESRRGGRYNNTHSRTIHSIQ